MDSEIVVSKTGTMFSGRDATNLVRAIYAQQALMMYAKTKMLMTRGATPTVLLRIATEYTGNKYKRGQYTRAAEEMGIWIETMKAALPVTVNE